MKVVNMIAWILVIVGGLNWLLVGLFDYNLVDSLFGEGSGLSRTVYVLVGVAALWALWDLVANRARATDRTAVTA